MKQVKQSQAKGMAISLAYFEHGSVTLRENLFDNHLAAIKLAKYSKAR